MLFFFFFFECHRVLHLFNYSLIRDIPRLFFETAIVFSGNLCQMTVWITVSNITVVV